MTVFDNIAFGLKVRRRPAAEVKARVEGLLHLVRLDQMGRRYPAQLSGGQRQRVALARALAIQPKLLLLDEPFGALDAKVRQELRGWLRRLHDEIHTTSVFVTHDQEEAFEVADEVVVMNAGRIEQRGTPQEVFEHPANRFVIDFLGNVNVFHGRVQEGRAHLGRLSLDYPEYPHAEPRPAAVYVRPHEWEIARSPNGRASVEARVERINPTGSVVKIGLVAPDHNDLSVDLSTVRCAELALQTGDKVWLSPKRIRVFAPEGADYVI
jgi:sulfate transport system ATP-binding protein